MSVYAAAVAASNTLRDQLEASVVTASASLLVGQQIASASGNGRTMAFSAPGANAVTPSDAVDCYQELILLLDDIEADSPLLTTDALKYAEMLGRLKPVRSTTCNFASLRTFG